MDYHFSSRHQNIFRYYTVCSLGPLVLLPAILLIYSLLHKVGGREGVQMGEDAILPWKLAVPERGTQEARLLAQRPTLSHQA